VKLLLDQNLSFRLVTSLTSQFPDSAHVRDFDLQRADDATIWSFAKDNDFVIVSKDEDFHQRSFLYGQPPKVVWVRLGNCTTDQVLLALRQHVRFLKDFATNDLAAFLILS
jgi:predicted nuclease of predicted toxin-antitoxin system